MASTSTFDVRPSDLNQALVRVILVSLVVAWSFVNASAVSLAEALRYKYLALALAYWTFSLLAYGWTYWLLRRSSGLTKALIVTRVLGIFADIGALSAYTAMAGTYGVILLPIYMNSIIGYGYRFGVRYLYFTLVVSAVFFAVALSFNDYIRSSRELIIAYFLGMTLVPLYSAALLRKHREVLERVRDLNDARSRFIANMSHELRTPLHAIISVSDVFRESLDAQQPAGESARQKMQMVTDSAQHLLGLVNKILDVAAADAGRAPSRPMGRVDLIRVTQSALRICQPNAQQQGIGFFWYFDANLPAVINGSADYLQEILINTVGNAVKYTPSGFVHARFELTTSAESLYLDITIVDTGIGISAKLLPNIFEPFILGDDSTARKYSGTGLGLTLTKQYVEMLGGTIRVESTEGVGTRCFVRLPLEPVEQTERSEQELELRPCVLVSSQQPSDAERAAFEISGWRCDWLSSDDLHSFQELKAPVVMIGHEQAADGDELLEMLASSPAARLLVLYGAWPDEVVMHRAIHCKVSGRDARELAAVRRLADAFFSFKMDVATSPGQTSEPITVLIADDNATNLATARMALESIGHEVTCVDSGDAALQQLDEHEFGLALVDMHMPGMSGIEVAQIYQFMTNAQGTPIVILTADATPEARAAAECCGAVAYLTKPLGARELREAVGRYARRLKPGRTQRVAVGSEAAMTVDTKEIDELIEIGVRFDDLVEMVADFESDSRSLIETALRAARANDVTAAKEAMHALKGAAATLGAKRLSLLAADFERSAGTPRLKAGADVERDFDSVLSDSVQLVRRRIAERAPAVGAP